jgi:hypothetical protein
MLTMMLQASICSWWQGILAVLLLLPLLIVLK